MCFVLLCTATCLGTDFCWVSWDSFALHTGHRSRAPRPRRVRGGLRLLFMRPSSEPRVVIGFRSPRALVGTTAGRDAFCPVLRSSERRHRIARAPAFGLADDGAAPGRDEAEDLGKRFLTACRVNPPFSNMLAADSVPGSVDMSVDQQLGAIADVSIPLGTGYSERARRHCMKTRCSRS